MNKLIHCALALVVLMLTSCDQDPFSMSTRNVVGPYMLRQWEDGETYYLQEKGKHENNGEAIDGTVTSIGWSDRYIIVKKYSDFRGDPDGWMTIDAQRKTIEGPYDDQTIAKSPEAKDMKFLPPKEAWQKLR